MPRAMQIWIANWVWYMYNPLAYDEEFISDIFPEMVN